MKFRSPGVYVIEADITIVKPFSKRYLRRIKIGNIFDIEVPNKNYFKRIMMG